MAVWTDIPKAAAAMHNRTRARQQAEAAIQRVAFSLRVEPAALSVAAYRVFRDRERDPGSPSPLAISVLFLGWQRACEHVAALVRDDAHVEADVARKLYGDPSCRQRAHGTSGRLSRPQEGDAIRKPGRLVGGGAAVSGATHANRAPIHRLESGGRPQS
jgi:hypothetical protein